MPRFPVDAPRAEVLRAFTALGFRVVREREHIALERVRSEGGRDTMTIPNHSTISAGTLRSACRQGSISREDFIAAYER